MASEEIMHLRDWRFSLRHRMYGIDCPMYDLDCMVSPPFIACESSDYLPRGLVEYKHYGTDWSKLKDRPISRVLTALGNAAGIPSWISVYDPHKWSYRVQPLNDLAGGIFTKQYHTEVEYVDRLWRLRGLVPPEEVLARLNPTNNYLDPEVQDAWINAAQRRWPR